MATTETPARSVWSSKWAFVLAAAASAVGLGNIWRFPYLAAEYGGGTFLFMYLVLVFTFGIAILLVETALGRKTGQSSIGAFSSFGKKYSFVGLLASVVPFIVIPYYCVLGGWVMKYAAAYLIDGPEVLADGGSYFSAFTSDGVQSFFWMFVFMVAVFVIVSRGLKGGIEKVNLIMMPTLIVAACGIALYTLTMPGAFEGVWYYLAPDLSAFSIELVLAALGQMFFSLSLAMGIMIAYGSYLDKKSNLTTSVAQIAGFDITVSFLAGLMIVPAAFVAMGSSAAVAENSGPDLMFIILPSVFADMGSAATIIGFVFFVLVLFAALTSAISFVETCTSIVQDGAGWSRKRSFACVVVFIVLAGSFVNLGYSALSFIEPLGAGTTLLDLFDFAANSVIMPVVALLTCIFVGWIISPQALIDEIELSAPFRAACVWSVIVKYIAPVLIVVVLVTFVSAMLA